MKKKTIIVIIVIAIVIIGGGIGWYKITSNFDQNLNKLTQTKIEDVDLSKISDGIYSGSYELLPVSVEVAVTIKEHKIDKIDLIKHNNGKGAAAEVIPDEVVKTGSLQVEAVSGATYSSRVILIAIKNALTSK